ncbi:MAG: zinc ribbon domain-containing protein [Pseudomonadota bacterium]
MPIYEFVCRGCHVEFEELVFHRDESVSCPHCAAETVERKLSAFAIHGQRADGSPVSASSGCSGGDCSGCSPGSCSCGH